MRRCAIVLMLLAVGGLTASASAGVVVGGTEMFPQATGADWGVGGPDGWQLMWETYKINTHREYFGSVGQILTTGEFWKDSKGQPDPGSHSDGPGTLAVQHLALWDGADPGQGEADPPYTGNQMQYITFPSTAGVTYDLSGFVNTVYIKHGDDYDHLHPKIVDHGNPPMPAQWPHIEIGLKNGAAVEADLTTSYTLVEDLLCTMCEPDAWVETPTVSLEATGDTMTIILKLQVPDISSSGDDPGDGRAWDLDCRWDDITLTPEPASLSLLGLGLMFVRRRRR